MGRFSYFLYALQIIGLGLILRRVPLGLPYPIVKYGGSILWGMMVVYGLRVIAPRLQSAAILGWALLIAIVVEFSRLIHTPALDAFRLSLPGALLLGRIFSPWNILAYGVGISLALVIDQTLHRQKNRK